MKVIGISGSARTGGNTALIMGVVLEEIAKYGIETELIELADRTILPCEGCFSCAGEKFLRRLDGRFCALL